MTVDQFVCFNQPKFKMEMVSFNYKKNSDFFNLLKESTTKFQKPVFDERIENFNQISHLEYAETITAQGFGFTFNFADDILNFDL